MKTVNDVIRRLVQGGGWTEEERFVALGIIDAAENPVTDSGSPAMENPTPPSVSETSSSSATSETSATAPDHVPFDPGSSSPANG